MDYVKLGERYCMDDYRMHMILMVFVRWLHQMKWLQYMDYQVRVQSLMEWNNSEKNLPRVTWIFPNGFLTRIEFFFHRCWVGPNDNQQTFMCTATEYIDFTPDGLIQHIGYITHPSQPEPVADYPTIVDETTTTTTTTTLYWRIKREKMRLWQVCKTKTIDAMFGKQRKSKR